MDHDPNVEKPVAIVLARAGQAAAPLEEMARLATEIEASGRVSKAVFAFSEQGVPTLKDAVDMLASEGCRDVIILPFILPLEPNFPTWIARTLQRWHLERGGDWPSFRIGRSLSEAVNLGALLAPMLASALAAAPVATSAKAATDGSILSDRRYRVLVCNGGPCTQAGAAVVGAHLRKLQVDRKLADRGDGMRSTRTSCLGPCALAPVVQVYPGGTFYGGVTEAAIERIVDEHLGQGRIVEAFAYYPAPRKQMIRAIVTAEAAQTGGDGR